MDTPDLRESLLSARNRLFWGLRSRLRWSRPGYRETGAGGLPLSEEERQIEASFGFHIYRPYLSGDTYRKNLWTLKALAETLGPHIIPHRPPSEILEPGCQDFSRLPALRSFSRKRGFRPRITGLEVDPYPVLHDLRSRWDKATYYISLEASADRYVPSDFFAWREPSDLICCFYPFVSWHPALAWGLPAEFGRPEPWVEGFVRNLRPDGLLLVVHQGHWEEESFDEARKGAPLRLLERRTFGCPFYPLPHPACFSVYRKEG